MAEREYNIETLHINIPLRYGDEDVSYDFPLRCGDMWEAYIEVTTGKIQDWPVGQSGVLYTKVCDAGVYELLDENGNQIVELSDYVPQGLVPGDYGDYVHLKIDENGVITNWPSRPDFSDFLGNMAIY